MKNSVSLLSVCFVFIMLSCDQQKSLDLAKIDPGSYDSTWYNRSPLRFIQTNLREIDANMDVDAYIEELVDASANVVLFNVGGIRASYPTKLPFHYKSPYLKVDLVGEVIEKCHENGIKFIARFDMSKVNESIAEVHPEWLYVGTDGKIVNYNGEVHTCFTGEYQQEHAFTILEEAISTYPFDGVFFNSRGFQTNDYSEIEHGICQCNNCKKGFRDSTGLKLPVYPDMNDPVYVEYKAWQENIRLAYVKRVKKLFKTLDPNLVYVNAQGPLRRSESGTSYTSLDYWTYQATENTKRTLGSSNIQMPADNCNYHMGMDYRHIATSPNIVRLFLAEQMLNGAGPALAMSGRIESQLDRVFLPEIKEIFKFHKTNEKLFTNLESRAKVGLVIGSSNDHRGIMRLLTEEHIMYDLILSSALDKEYFPRKLDSYDALILSNVTEMGDNYVALIDDYVKGGGRLLSTGFPGIYDGKGKENKVNGIRLQCLGVNSEYQMFPKTKSTYLKVEDDDKTYLGKDDFENFDVLMMYSEFMKCQPDANATAILKLVPNTMYGPPEKCYFTEANVTDVPGMVVNEYGKGKSVLIPWLLGAQYNWRGNNAHRALFKASLQNLLQIEDQLVTDCSPLIEMTHFENRAGAFEWVGMINHSGQIGDVFHEPIPIYNRTIRFQPVKPIKSIHLVRSGKPIKFNQKDGWVECIVPEIDDFEMILCQYK
jgi:hypothetical protein